MHPQPIRLEPLSLSAPDPACELPLPLQQSAAYSRARLAERFSIWRGQRYLGELSIIKRRIFGIQVARLYRGPIWRSTPTPDDWAELLPLLHARYTSRYARRFLWVPPETEAQLNWKDFGVTEWMNGGWHGWLDIRQDTNAMRLRMEKKWHQALVKGESVDASIIPHALRSDAAQWVLSGGRPSSRRALGNLAVRWALSLHRRGATLRIYTLQDGRTTLWSPETALAGALFIRHGTSATYHLGLASNRAWEQGFMHRLLWQAILSLKKEGVHWLYFGQLSGDKTNAERERFTFGIGTRPAMDGGVWLA